MNKNQFNFELLPIDWIPTDARLEKFLSSCVKSKESDCIIWTTDDIFDGLIGIDINDRSKDMYIPNYPKTNTKKVKKRFHFNNKCRYVNKIVYTWCTGEVSTDLSIINTCKTNNCINFEHLKKRECDKTKKRKVSEDPKVKSSFYSENSKSKHQKISNET